MRKKSRTVSFVRKLHLWYRIQLNAFQTTVDGVKKAESEESLGPLRKRRKLVARLHGIINHLDNDLNPYFDTNFIPSLQFRSVLELRSRISCYTYSNR